MPSIFKLDGGPLLIRSGLIQEFAQSKVRTNHGIGGPAPLDIPGNMHHILTFGRSIFEGKEIPLIFGLTWSGFMCRYSVFEGFKILEVEPEGPLDFWPYEHYPKILPYYCLEPLPARAMTAEEREELAGLMSFDDDYSIDDKSFTRVIIRQNCWWGVRLFDFASPNILLCFSINTKSGIVVTTTSW